MIESKRGIKPIGNSSFLYNLTPEIIYNINVEEDFDGVKIMIIKLKKDNTWIYQYSCSKEDFPSIIHPLKINHVLSNKDVIEDIKLLLEEINELKNELKNSIIGNSVVLGLDFPKIFLDDENKEKNNILIAKEIKEKHRILTRKGYVYDSFDDEENIDEIISFNYINPNAFIIKFIDLFVFILTFYNIIFLPLFLGKSDIYCEVNYQSYFIFLFNILIDIVFIIDIIINF